MWLNKTSVEYWDKNSLDFEISAFTLKHKYNFGHWSKMTLSYLHIYSDMELSKNQEKSNVIIDQRPKVHLILIVEAEI